MIRTCYVTPILPGKQTVLRSQQANIERSWSAIGVGDYRCFIQGDHVIQHLAGDVETIFGDLRRRITEQDQAALELQRVYREVTGVDYGVEESVPALTLRSITEIGGETVHQRAFFYPIVKPSLLDQ